MKYLMFSRVFPAYHPRKGEETDFAFKIWNGFEHGLTNNFKQRYFDLIGWRINAKEHYTTLPPKYHTIRAGHRWKPGDIFVPRVWVGAPYKSKQLDIADPITVASTWGFYIDCKKISSMNERHRFRCNGIFLDKDINEQIARNDGLSVQDFNDWLINPCFKKGKSFYGQIICWNHKIKY